MGSSSFKVLSRLFNGFSMIAKEAVRRSDTLNTVRDRDFQSLIKKVLVSATNLSGLTEGIVREFSNPVSSSRESNFFFGVSNSDTVSDSTEEVQSAPDRVVDKTSSIGAECFDLSRGSLGADVEDSNNAPPNLYSSHNLDHVYSISTESGKRNVFDMPIGEEVTVVQPKRRKPRERKVPSTPFFRAVGFAGLGASLAWGTIQESAKRFIFGTPNPSDKQSVLSPFLSEKNGERLALALCRMRGAALKIGQMLSIQDETLVPAPILAALDIVRQGADVMPKSQLNHVLDAELGKGWTSKLTSFDYEPIAAASIGQVHRAVTRDGLTVAMKIQYPGVANSIESDIENVKLLLDYTNLIPEGLFLDQAIKVAKKELSCECDYNLESNNQKRFRDLLSNNEGFYVPVVIDDLSTKKVLTTELISGIPIDKVALLNQDVRDYVGRKLLELTLMELFVFRFMQTDPNWGNFLFEESTRIINLIDFGAARDYPKSFVDNYLRMVVACSNKERDTVLEMSCRLGFLTGTESDVMLDAHVQAGFVVGLPFSKPGGYDFGSSNIAQSVSNLGARMLRHRAKPPPDEAYSLHRKLSGAFLACIKLRAVVPCRQVLLHVYEHYQFGEPNAVYV